MPRLNDDTICKQVFDGDCYNDDAVEKNIAMDASMLVMVLLLLKAIFTMLMDRQQNYTRAVLDYCSLIKVIPALPSHLPASNSNP